jgi:hypothetical protein
MGITVAFIRFLLGFGCPLILALPVAAAINAYSLGASYDATRSNIIFRVYSSRATRIKVDLYASPTGSADVLRFAGSSDLFGSRKSWNSTNFMVVHDGFTLNTTNNNQPWPYGPSDGGSSKNYSWDQGGAAADRRAAARVGFALLMLSAGTPLMTGGDEYLRSLH